MAMQQQTERVIQYNNEFLEKAEQLKPTFRYKEVKPVDLVKVNENPNVIHGWEISREAGADILKSKEFGKGDEAVLDFKTHLVGRVTFDVNAVGSPPDAPAYIRLTFGEMPVEVGEDFSDYNGWLSRSWLQEEYIHVDTLPTHVELPRRYCFRFMKMEVLDTSRKYNVTISNVICRTETSANEKPELMVPEKDKLNRKLEQVSLLTLENCMQDVFEDGPKRDRRLWLGDLRLQAQANYGTFNNDDLVKRCLYLFAAAPDSQGKVAANLFIHPTLMPDDTYLFDYSLFFSTTLYDYAFAANEWETALNLWSTAFRQYEIAAERIDGNDLLMDDESWWSFIDWKDGLNKQAPSHGVFMYALQKGIALAEKVGTDQQTTYLRELYRQLKKAALSHLWSSEKKFFVSGSDKQVSIASQVWMILGGALDKNEAQKLLKRIENETDILGMNTPYMYHHYVEALFQTGLKEEAVKQLQYYWGGMLDHGADTFWELYNPEDLNFSPYGSHIINSYCHAWSCTPIYFLRKYLYN
ncbi:family 78 glycoside hydrolase catalytic domain [Alkalicoccus halolimnae]|uniref:Family 78 glycoside hydrolase catalytic domain n=1 Tax=Alkalicoccus halolimnae TaxID=1667239 RepID=A0A5C7F7Y0_9BACI|nr:family 78 glycoside hydrolase catalytic domain [Alkalicoccus halolimnae]TXF86153.1 Bacterial alpha-L-rhamnosidase [Alkalicoccus halolimnae]